ncbi:MAG TPA: Flp pilus assembly protein CpaB [Bryobacteraceae bacterium]|nr:Flp pilus assembly protein CpaB [Bryobacteraceae bacterium]
MNKRFLSVLIFAFVVATVASLLLYRLMSNRQPTASAAHSTTRIAVATRNLEVGTILKDGDVKLDDWSGATPDGATANVQEVIGRGVVTPIFAREPVIESRLAAKGAGGGLAAMIPPGMRAVAVRVNEVVGVAGFVLPGMRVDVLISGNPPGVGNTGLGTLTRTLLQNLEVLSAGQDFKKDSEGKPIMVQVVNLLVTPAQAEQLSLAASQTTIQLVLRNPLDRDVTKTPGTALAKLFTGGTLHLENSDDEKSRPRPVAVVAKAPVIHEAQPKKEAPFVMEIIEGTKKNEMKFVNAGAGEDK